MSDIYFIDHVFHGAVQIPAVGSENGNPLVYKDTSAAGSPTTAIQTGGFYRLKFASTNEVENLCLYGGDVLTLALAKLRRATFWVKAATALGAAERVVFGVGSARNDDPDAVATNAFFSCAADSNVDVCTDDGTNDTSAAGDGLTLSTSWQKFMIDFVEGIYVNPPAGHQGGLYDVHFYVENANGVMRRVAKSTRFDMSNASTGSVQPIVQAQKTAATSVGGIDVKRILFELST